MDRIVFILVSLMGMQVTVANEPKLELLPSTILKALGDPVYVSCKANVDDKALVTDMRWVGPHDIPIPNVDETISTLAIDGPGKLDLIIKNLREEDTGEYRCYATYVGNQLETSINVRSFMDVSFGNTPIHQTPRVGEDASIRCEVRSVPAPQVDWLKDGVPLKSDSRHIIKQDSVLVKNISELDEGVYRCRARVPELGTLKHLDIKVEVMVPPYITGRPKDTAGVEKEAVTFQCIAKGKPAPVYTWVDKDSRNLKDIEGFYVDEITGELTIMDLRPEHDGMYRCTAENAAGEDVAQANLRVLTKPIVEQYLNLTVNVNQTAEMRCIVTGDPLPLVVFQKETNPEPFITGTNADSRIDVEQIDEGRNRRVGIMRIRDLARRDDGLYTCTGKSDGGVTQVWGHITVQFAPTFEQQPTTHFWTWDREPVNITCIATSIPNATGILRVVPVDTSYFGVYTCEATNILGRNTIDLELKEVHKPGPVGFTKVKRKTATTITWEIADPVVDGGRPILGFYLEYREQDASWEDAELHYWAKGATYILDELLPRKMYAFRFAAKNEVGRGEWGSATTEEMPAISSPEEPLIYGANAPVNNIPYSNYYDLQWQVPLDNGKPIDHFQITYYPVKNASKGWIATGQKLIREVKYPGPSTYKISDLSSGTNYRIELRAHNEIGYSLPAETVIHTALGGPDTEAVVEDGMSSGALIAIAIIVIIFVIAVVLDVTCFFAKNIGVTALIARKTISHEKDKEAMLEDGVNTGDEKPEGNGKVKDEKPKQEKEMQDKAEPTEITPMIQGDPGDKEAILKEEEKSAAEQEVKKEESKGSINKDSAV